MTSLPQIKERSCGDCSACCTVLAIPTLKKIRYVPCEHLRRGNKCCRIYETRPDECSGYACAWKLGVGTRHQRPDQLGVVFSLEDTIFGPTLIGMEVRDGCGEKPAAIELGLGVARPRDIALIMGGKEWRKILHVPKGKEDLVMQYLETLKGKAGSDALLRAMAQALRK